MDDTRLFFNTTPLNLDKSREHHILSLLCPLFTIMPHDQDFSKSDVDLSWSWSSDRWPWPQETQNHVLTVLGLMCEMKWPLILSIKCHHYGYNLEHRTSLCVATLFHIRLLYANMSWCFLIVTNARRTWIIYRSTIASSLKNISRTKNIIIRKLWRQKIR